MKNSTKVLIGIAVVALLSIFWFIGTRNNLVSLKEDVQMQQAQIETNLQRRSELIPNLVATVKGYAKHEEEVFTQIADARAMLSGYLSTRDINGMLQANDELNSALNRLLAISESYPELKANENFVALQDELVGTENRIATERKYFNEKVNAYNSAIQKFPTSIVASMSGFSEINYFSADEGAKEAPVVGFE